MAKMLTLERLKQQVRYDPTTGQFTWRSARAGVSHGAVAGCANNNGYVRINILRQAYYAHRLAWFYMTGIWPDHSIDHINSDPSDNRWSNLRPATHSQNLMNVAIRSDNTSGVKGVSWHKQMRKWRAFITVDGRMQHLGLFDSIEDATKARQHAAKQFHGDFARHK